jgi:hypothetical protein
MAKGAVMLNAINEAAKKRGPGQTRRLTGTALGRVICDGGPDQTQPEPSLALLRANDSRTYPQARSGPKRPLRWLTEPARRGLFAKKKARQNSLR